MRRLEEKREVSVRRVNAYRFSRRLEQVFRRRLASNSGAEG